LLVIDATGATVEEWRTEKRLLGLAKKRPKEFFKDDDGTWHYRCAEEYFEKLGIPYRLRSDEELPRKLVTNCGFLRDYLDDRTPPLQPEKAANLQALFATRHAIPHLQLINELGFEADDIFVALLKEIVYVDLYEQRLDLTDELIIYRDKAARQLHSFVQSGPPISTPGCALELKIGKEITYDGVPYTVTLLGERLATLKTGQGLFVQVPIAQLEEHFKAETLAVSDVIAPVAPASLDLGNAKAIDIAWARLEALADPAGSGVPARTLRRWNKAISGIDRHHDQVLALMPKWYGKRGHRISDEVLRLAMKAVEDHHNTKKAPTISSTFLHFKTLCSDAMQLPMSQTSFFKWIKEEESVKKRQGHKVDYQKAPIELTYEDDMPVNGTHPHSIVYIDHTDLNLLVRGMNVENLGKPCFSVALDGSNGEPMAIFLDFRKPSADTVLMVLRDYVIRHGRLPSTIVVDNGPDFRSSALKRFCRIFKIDIRWRRRSKPRDSSRIERLFCTTETEILASMDGNTRSLKFPRTVPKSHQPGNHIAWTLPAVHGAFSYFLFDIYMNRVHPRLGVSPAAFKARQLHELGRRSHIVVRYDDSFRLLTASHPVQKPCRDLDRQRGVFVNGMWYWHGHLAKAKPKEQAEVRLERWCARVVYVRFRDQWLVAHARDGGRLIGRFLPEVEAAIEQERRVRRTLAQNSKTSKEVAAKKKTLTIPSTWDDRLQDQEIEVYELYSRLGMTEALEAAKNPRAGDFHVGTPGAADLALVVDNDEPAAVTLPVHDVEPVSLDAVAEDFSNDYSYF
jgi:putative transposase